MAYVAVKGGEQAINNSHKLIAETRRGDTSVPELSPVQIGEQLGLAVDRVMVEGSLYDRDLAALALKQAQGDMIEAIFLLRAYRTSLPRFCYTTALDTTRMAVRRRISATFKDIPGGQVLGPTYDYTHRLLDFKLAADGGVGEPEAVVAVEPLDPVMPRIVDVLGDDDLLPGEVDDSNGEVFDLTREPMQFPAGRDQRLQGLVRGDEGFLLGLAYSTIRGYGYNHPFVGELKLGEVIVAIEPEELGFAIEVGEITVTECEMVTQFQGTADTPPQFTRGYGLAFGHCERKVMSMALLDRAMRVDDYGEEARYPAQDEQFVLSHSDSLEANGLIAHYRLPHYVDFQAELHRLRQLRAEHEGRSSREPGQ